MKTQKWMLLAVLAAGLVLSSGCAVLLVGGAAAAGAGTVAYIRGDLNATLDGTLERTIAATKAGLRDAQMPVTAEENDGITAKFTARARGDKKVTIHVKKVTGTTTSVSIRVGVWGDEAVSREILEKIKSHL